MQIGHRAGPQPENLCDRTDRDVFATNVPSDPSPDTSYAANLAPSHAKVGTDSVQIQTKGDHVHRRPNSDASSRNRYSVSVPVASNV